MKRPRKRLLRSFQVLLSATSLEEAKNASGEPYRCLSSLFKVYRAADLTVGRYDLWLAAFSKSPERPFWSARCFVISPAIMGSKKTKIIRKIDRAPPGAFYWF